MDHSAAPAPYPYGQPTGYPPYPYPYPPANAAWPPSFDPAMLPYPDPRMYAGGVPGYYDPMAVRPPPTAADFYAAAVSLHVCSVFMAHKRPKAKLCQKPLQIFANLRCSFRGQAARSTGTLYVNVQMPHTSNLLNDAWFLHQSARLLG